MQVSVVITTKNEEKNIENCLKSLENQDFLREDMEIIVVDNNSADRTKEIALNYTERVFDEGPERSAQRNFGASHASGKYVFYLDADMILGRHVIKNCVEMMEKDFDIAALYISEKIRSRGFWGKVRNFERSFYDGTVIDAVRFVRKDKFEEVGGFDENLTGPEDWDFDKRIRSAGKVELLKTPTCPTPQNITDGNLWCGVFHNEESFKLKKYLARKKYYAKDFDKYIAKWGKGDPDIKKQFGFWYRYFGVFTEKGKWKKLFRHPILALGMYFLRFWVGMGYLKS